MYALARVDAMRSAVRAAAHTPTTTLALVRALRAFTSLTNTRARIPINPTSLSSQRVHLLRCRFCTPEAGAPKAAEPVALKAESKVAKQVHLLKNAAETAAEAPAAAHGGAAEVAKPAKPGIVQRIKDEVLHFYNGGKLLYYDTKISTKLLYRLLQGDVLTRRQRRQLVRTSSDLFRLVPFMVFVIVPFMEFLLPVALKLFPNMLPSTFDDKSKVEQKKLGQLKAKLEMAKFLQDTVAEMAATTKSKQPSSNLTEFSQLLQKIRTNNETLTNQDILSFTRLFEDELTLDNLGRPQLVALLSLLNRPAYGTSAMLRFQLRTALRKLKADDQMIMAEGVDSLTVAELQAACQERGMRAIGLPLPKLRQQLEQWLELNLKEGVPASLILLTRTMYVTGNEVTPDALRSTVLYGLGDKLVSEAEVIVAEMAGAKVANKTKLELLAKEEKMIAEELEESKSVKLQAEKARQEKEKAQQEKEKLKDTAPELAATQTPSTPASPPAAGAEIPAAPIPQGVTAMDLLASAAAAAKDTKKEKTTQKEIILQEELATLADVVANKFTADVIDEQKEVLKELRDERTEHKQAMAELKEATKNNLKETVGSRLVGRKVEKMLNSLEKDLAKAEAKMAGTDLKYDTGIVALEELINEGTKAGSVDRTKMLEIAKMFDLDGDGYVTADEIKTVFEYLKEEGSDVTPADIARVVQLIHMEGSLLKKTEKEGAEKPEKSEKSEKTEKPSSPKAAAAPAQPKPAAEAKESTM
eukprot:comp23765_c0_seq1/m.41155 comp23765_c0_seq1/g.41155  ORF comp23765_c0_seq1/g.41155 comp23765_c0_seq1/m.41155 type:complete len:755 (-) comp23765_c0_seq1:6-2270(-)